MTRDLEWLRASTAATVTRADVAALLDVDERTVTRAVEAGQIPSLRVGHRVLIPRLPLLELLGAHVDAAAHVSRVLRPADREAG
jgi:excisionase family DNA binding protein